MEEIGIVVDKVTNILMSLSRDCILFALTNFIGVTRNKTDVRLL